MPARCVFFLAAFDVFFGWIEGDGVGFVVFGIGFFEFFGFISAGIVVVGRIGVLAVSESILCGRLTTAFLSTKVKKENLLPAMGVGIVLFFIVLIMSKSTTPIVIGIMGFGFSMAGIYATTVSFAGELIKKYSLAWSFILTTASLGSIIMPSIVGFIADDFGIATGVGSIAIALFIDMIFIMILVRKVKKGISIK